jgi:hypothetical protein
MSLIDRLIARAALLRAQASELQGQADDLAAAAAELAEPNLEPIDPVDPAPVEPEQPPVIEPEPPVVVDPPAPPPVEPPASPPVEPPAPPPTGQTEILATVAPNHVLDVYFSPEKPGSDEDGGYNRHPVVFFWDRPGLITWEWTWAQGVDPAGRRMRLLVDGQPATGWVSPNPAAKGRYAFTFDLPDGHYLADVEAEDPAQQPKVMRKPFVVNRSGRALPEQTPWRACTRFDQSYIGLPNYAVKVRYPGHLPVPKTFPLKPREIKPYSHIPPRNQMWCRRISQHFGAASTPRFTLIPTGDVAIELDQKYFYQTATTVGGFDAGRSAPRHTMRDGTRGLASLGPVYKIIVRSGGEGMYLSESTDRWSFMDWSGKVLTEAGWYLPADQLKAHGAIVGPGYMYASRPEHKAFYEGTWRRFGEWSQVRGPHRTLGPWGIAVAMLRADGTIDNRNGHEAWGPDTDQHRINFYDHWTAHALAMFEKAHLAPLGYKQAEGPTGQTTVFTFVGNDDCTPSYGVNGPWDCEVRPNDAKLYWTNYDGNSLACASLLDPSDILEFPSSRAYTDEELGIPERLGRRNEEPHPIQLRGGIIGRKPTNLDSIPAGAVVINGRPLPAIPEAVGKTAGKRQAARLDALVAAINGLGAGVSASITGSVALLIELTDHLNYHGVAFEVASEEVAEQIGIDSQTTTSVVIDGPIGVATIVRPQAIRCDSKGKIIFAERYTYALREFDPDTRTIRTLCGILPINGGSSSSGNNDISFDVNVDGTCGPQDCIYVVAWGNSSSAIFARDGSLLCSTIATVGGSQDLSNGPLDMVRAPGYAWGVGCGGGRVVLIGNAAGSQCIEMTLKLDTDPRPTAAVLAGRLAYYASPMCLSHGPEGQGELGLPTIEEMGSWPDDKLRSYAAKFEITKVDEFVSWVRYSTIDQDYGAEV